MQRLHCLNKILIVCDPYINQRGKTSAVTGVGLKSVIAHL